MPEEFYVVYWSFLVTAFQDAPSRCVHKPVHTAGRSCAQGCTALRVLDVAGPCNALDGGAKRSFTGAHVCAPGGGCVVLACPVPNPNSIRDNGLQRRAQQVAPGGCVHSVINTVGGVICAGFGTIHTGSCGGQPHVVSSFVCLTNTFGNASRWKHGRRRGRSSIGRSGSCGRGSGSCGRGGGRAAPITPLTVRNICCRWARFPPLSGFTRNSHCPGRT